MILYVVLGLLILYIYLAMQQKEGFSLIVKQDGIQQKTYLNEKIDDSFYAYNYDDMNLTIPYYIELIQKIHSYFHIHGRTLCLGSRTGHLVQLLSKTTHTIGVDPSIAMVKMSHYKYPKQEFIQGSYLDPSVFPDHRYSQVIMPLFTLHTLPHLKEVFVHVKNTLIHSGYFFVCFVDIRTFPVYKKVNHHPSEYFRSNYDYTVEWKDQQEIETIIDKKGTIRTNLRDLYLYNASTLLYEARNAGFTHVKTLTFDSIPMSIAVLQYK